MWSPLPPGSGEAAVTCVGAAIASGAERASHIRTLTLTPPARLQVNEWSPRSMECPATRCGRQALRGCDLALSAPLPPAQAPAVSRACRRSQRRSATPRARPGSRTGSPPPARPTWPLSGFARVMAPRPVPRAGKRDKATSLHIRPQGRERGGPLDDACRASRPRGTVANDDQRREPGRAPAPRPRSKRRSDQP